MVSEKWIPARSGVPEDCHLCMGTIRPGVRFWRSIEGFVNECDACRREGERAEEHRK